jgi:hypothetical protein
LIVSTAAINHADALCMVERNQLSESETEKLDSENLLLAGARFLGLSVFLELIRSLFEQDTEAHFGSLPLIPPMNFSRMRTHLKYNA